MRKNSVLLSILLAASLTACGGGASDTNAASAGAAHPADTVAVQSSNTPPVAAPVTGNSTPPADTAGGSAEKVENAGMATQAASWTVQDVGTLGDYASIGGAIPDINANGQLIAVSAPTPYVRNSVMIADGKITQLVMPDRSVRAAGINDAGHVVGYTFIPGRPATEMYPFIYREGLMSSFGSVDSQASDINNAGQVTGNATFADGHYKAFLYSDGIMSELGTLGTGARSWAMAINDHGQVVGSSLIARDDFATDHAFLYTNGKMIDLGTLGEGARSQAVAINNQGQVVGWSQIRSNDPNAVPHAFFYSDGKMTDLGPVQASDINNHGDIVGSANARAFIYRDGKFTDLNSLPGVAGSGWTLAYASAINDRGDIVGTGTLNGEERAFLLATVRK